MEILFSYGSLQYTNVQSEILGQYLHGVHDALLGYTTESIDIDGVPYLRAIPSKKDTLHGTRYLLSEKELRKIDAYEGASYTRLKKFLQSGIEAWIYIRP